MNCFQPTTSLLSGGADRHDQAIDRITANGRRGQGSLASAASTGGLLLSGGASIGRCVHAHHAVHIPRLDGLAHCSRPLTAATASPEGVGWLDWQESRAAELLR